MVQSPITSVIRASTNRPQSEPQFSIWPATVRDPSTQQANAASQNDLVANQMDQIRASLQSRLYHIFTMETDYFDMSSDSSIDDSLEAVHDTVHVTVGSGGHMSEIPYAAFDPIFWLHHAYGSLPLQNCTINVYSV